MMMKKNKIKPVSAALAILLLLSILLPFPLIARDPGKTELFDGSGTAVAVLSRGFSGIGNERFNSNFSGGLTKKAVRDLYPSLEGKGIYLNGRIPFAYDYAGADTILTGSSNQGMTLCDIMAAEIPAAQLIPMKIYDDDGKLNYGAVCSALRDSFLLDAAVILLDIDEFAGTGAGFPLPDEAARLISEADKRGIAVVCAAGNNGRTGIQSLYQGNYGIEYPSAARQDYGTVSAPSSMDSVISVGSRESRTYKAPCISYGKNGKTTFSDTNSRYDIEGSHTFSTFFDGRTIGYIPVGGTGTEEDCASAGDMKGKIALIKRGDLTFTQKINNAAGCGAVGAVIYDNVENNAESVLMALEGALIPAVFISYESGIAMLAETDRNLYIKDGDTISLETENGGSISLFSSRGVTPELGIKPELVAEGGSRDIMLFGTGNTSKETVGSGTLFSAAEMAAKIAALAGYYRASGIEYSISSLKLALMNAASPVPDENGVYFSPRAQGAGAIEDPASVIYADSLLYGAGGDGKITLGDGLRPSFQVKVTVVNISEKTLSYKLSANMAGDGYIYYKVGDNGLAYETDDKNEAEPGFPAFIAPYARPFTSASVTLSDIRKNGGNLNSYSEDYEPALIRLKPDEKRELILLCVLDGKTSGEYASIFPDGYFIDGYITLTSEEGNVSSVPYSGFCGRFGRLNAFDSSVYEADPYYGGTFYYSEMKEDGITSEVRLGYNRRMTEMLFKKELVAFSPDGDGNADSLSFAFCLLRNVSDVRIAVYDQSSRLFTLHVEGDLGKSFADKFTVNKYRTAVWDGKAADNTSFTYPDGKYKMILSAVPAIGPVQTVSFPFVIDTEAPVFNSYEIYTGKDGGRYLSAEISDNHYITEARLYTSGNEADRYESTRIFDEPVSEYTCVFDITGLSREFLYLEISDYAFNTETYRIELND